MIHYDDDDHADFDNNDDEEDRVKRSCWSVGCHNLRLDVKVKNVNDMSNFDTLQCGNPNNISHFILPRI
jgi:hypothetical protein